MAATPDERAVLIVGGGRMGEALLAGLLADGRAADELAVAEVSSSRRDELAAAHPGVTVVRAPIPAAGVLGGRDGGHAAFARTRRLIEPAVGQQAQDLAADGAGERVAAERAAVLAWA